MAFFQIERALIYSLLFHLLLCVSPTYSAKFLRDKDGKAVLNGGSYSFYLRFPAPDEGQIIWVNSSKSNPCPLYIVQNYYPISLNEVVQTQPDYSFTIRSHLKSKYIPLNAPVDITYNDKYTPCKNPLKWSVKPDGKFKNTYDLVAGYNNTSYKGTFRFTDGGKDDFGNDVYNLFYCFRNNHLCLQVGQSNLFPRTGNFIITSDPENVKFWGFKFELTS